MGARRTPGRPGRSRRSASGGDGRSGEASRDDYSTGPRRGRGGAIDRRSPRLPPAALRPAPADATIREASDAGVSESADDGDSKSPGLTPVGVRAPPPAPRPPRRSGESLWGRAGPRERTFVGQQNPLR